MSSLNHVEEKIKQLEANVKKIYENEYILKKKIKKLQKQFNLTKKSKVLNTILDIFEKIEELKINNYNDSDSYDNYTDTDTDTDDTYYTYDTD